MMKRPSYRYDVLIQSQDTGGRQNSFVAQESTQQDAFLLAAKMVGYYQARYSVILRVRVQDLKKGCEVLLPKKLTSLWF